MATGAYRRVASGTTLDIVTPDLVAQSQYPSEWFNANKSRPVLNICVGPAPLEELAGYVLKGYVSHNTPISITRAFLYSFFVNVKETLSEDWVSYGVPIATKGEEISPMDLLRVVTQNLSVGNAVGEKCDAENYPWLAMAHLGPARLCRIKENAYADEI